MVAHGVAELDHGLAEVREAVRVDLKLAGLRIMEDSQALRTMPAYKALSRPIDQLPNVMNDSQVRLLAAALRSHHDEGR